MASTMSDNNWMREEFFSEQKAKNPEMDEIFFRKIMFPPYEERSRLESLKCKLVNYEFDMWELSRYIDVLTYIGTMEQPHQIYTALYCLPKNERKFILHTLKDQRCIDAVRIIDRMLGDGKQLEY
jgi:hypothetical protein